MIRRTLASVACMIDASLESRWGGVEIHGVSTDTRTLQPGNLFVPIVGERFDGHQFAEEAVRKGAAALLWKRDTAGAPKDVPILYVDDTLRAIQRLAAAYRRQLGVRVIGVTGSNGKTSTKDMLASVLSVRYKTQKTPGNLNNQLGVPLTLLGLDEDAEYAVVEMGMSGLGEIRELCRIAKPDTGIITNVSEVHLGDLHTRERIMQAKLEMAECMTTPDHLFIYNGDHERMYRIVHEMNLPCKRVTFGQRYYNQLRAEEIRVTREGVSFRTGELKVHIPVLGKHQAMNALAVIAAAKHAGLTDEEIRRGFAQVQLTGMRMEWEDVAGISIINDAYKSNPSSVRAALDLVYELEPYERKIVVLGDMVELGEESVELHREIGRYLSAEHLSYVFTIGSSAKDIARTAAGRFAPGKVIACDDQEQLLRKLLPVMAEGTLLLVKGSRTLGLERLVDALKREVGDV